MMRNSNATQRASWTVGDVCRRMLLSWLTAVLVQYLCLSPGNRSLEGLEGLAAQSVWLLLGLTAAVFGLLFCLAWRFDTVQAERWAMFGVFGILVAMSLCASLTPGYLLGCLVILAILGVYAWRGWRRTETAAAPAEGGDRAGRILTAGFALAFLHL